MLFLRLKSMEKPKLEFIARITTEDGRVIEKKVVTEEGIPSIDEFDFEDVDNFLDTFDSYERATIKARNKICSEITDAYLELGKKKRTPRTPQK